MGISKLMNYRNWKYKFATYVADHSILVIVTIIAITILLLYPMIRMEPTQQASPNPPGQVYDMQADIDDKFPTPLHFASYVLEPKNGDVITADVLREFAGNRDRVSDLDKKGELAAGTLDKQQYLFTYFNNECLDKYNDIILDNMNVYDLREKMIQWYNEKKNKTSWNARFQSKAAA